MAAGVREQSTTCSRVLSVGRPARSAGRAGVGVLLCLTTTVDWCVALQRRDRAGGSQACEGGHGANQSGEDWDRIISNWFKTT